MKKSTILNVVISVLGGLSVLCLAMVLLNILAPGGILEKMVYGGLLILYRAGILLPSVLALAAAVLIWIKKIKGRYLLSFGLSLGGVVILLFTELVLVPWQITRYLDGISFFSEAVESALGMLDICRIAMGVLGTEYLVGALLLAVMSCLCLAGNYLKENIPSGEREKEQPEEKTMSLEREPAILGLKGDYAGGRIPLRPGDSLMIGSDNRLCNLVTEGNEISGQHCCVEYNKEKDEYLVQDLSETGTYTNDGRRLKTGEGEWLCRNSLLILGSEENTFLLE